MDAAGYGKYLEPFVKAGVVKASMRETAILAGGCFWGMFFRNKCLSKAGTWMCLPAFLRL